MNIMRFSVLAALLSITGLAQAAPQYSISLLGTVNAHHSVFTPAINNAGVVSGYGYTDPNTPGKYFYDSSTAATWSNGVASPLKALPGTANGMATASNLHGQTVGISWTHMPYELPLGAASTSTPYDGQATLWQQGTATLLPGLYNNYGEATDINNRGQIIGWSAQGSSGTIATVWNNNIPTALASLPGYEIHAYGINDQGIIVGSAKYENRVHVAVFWNSQNELQWLSGINGQSASGVAIAVNENGVIAGTTSGADGRQHATIWVDGQALDLGLAGGWASFAYGLNNQGDVVGSHLGEYEGEIGEYALLWQNGVAINLNSLANLPDNVVLTYAHDINDSGYIIAQGYINAGDDAERIYRTYLLAPVPEPSSYALMLAGLALIGVSRRKR